MRSRQKSGDGVIKMHSQSNRGKDKNAKKSSQKLSSKLIIEEPKNAIKSNPSAKKSEKRSAKGSAKGSKKQSSSSKKISESNNNLDPDDRKSKDKEMIELKKISLSFKKESDISGGQSKQEQEIQEPAQ